MTRIEPGDPRCSLDTEVKRVAETHYFLRIHLVGYLETVDLRHLPADLLGGARTYADYWRSTYSDRYFDMGTLQRLATGLETGLRAYHRAVAGKERARGVARGSFQRLVEPDQLVALFEGDCGYRLPDNPEWQSMRELMAHRHLYAHRSGNIDDKYLDDLRLVTGKDLRPEVEQLGYPDEEVLWFGPLGRLGDFIESARRFVRALPPGPTAGAEQRDELGGHE